MNTAMPAQVACWPSRLRRGLLAAALALSGACSQPGLDHAAASAEGLAATVLEALARNDRRALEALALSETEFRALVWPELPAARPERNLPWDYVWGDLRQKSRNSLASILAQHGGRRYRLVAVSFQGNTTRYPTFEVRRETTLAVRDDTGEQKLLRFFGSTLVASGRHKVFSYVVE